MADFAHSLVVARGALIYVSQWGPQTPLLGPLPRRGDGLPRLSRGTGPGAQAAGTRLMRLMTGSLRPQP